MTRSQMNTHAHIPLLDRYQSTMAHSPAPCNSRDYPLYLKASCLPSPPPLESPPLVCVCVCVQHRSAHPNKTPVTATRKGNWQRTLSALLTGQTDPNEPRTGDGQEPNAARQRRGKQQREILLSQHHSLVFHLRSSESKPSTGLRTS